MRIIVLALALLLGSARPEAATLTPLLGWDGALQYTCPVGLQPLSLDHWNLSPRVNIVSSLIFVVTNSATIDVAMVGDYGGWAEIAGVHKVVPHGMPVNVLPPPSPPGTPSMYSWQEYRPFQPDSLSVGRIDFWVSSCTPGSYVYLFFEIYTRATP